MVFYAIGDGKHYIKVLHWFQLNPTKWKVPNHDKGAECTVDCLNSTVDTFNITKTTKVDPKYMAVKGKQSWDFILIHNYALSLLNIQMNIFNDIDNLFMDRVQKILQGSHEEWKLNNKFILIEEKIQAARVALMSSIV